MEQLNYWRLLSESFDRDLSDEEKRGLEQFIDGQDSAKEFREFLSRVRSVMEVETSIANEQSDAMPELKVGSKDRIQQLMDAALGSHEQASLRNRDLLLASALVNQGAFQSENLTASIANWNSDSQGLSSFLQNQLQIPEDVFEKIETDLSETIFDQAVEGTVDGKVVAAIIDHVGPGTGTIFEEAFESDPSQRIGELIDNTIGGESGAFKSLHELLSQEVRSVFRQSSAISKNIRLKAVADEVFLRLFGTNKLNQEQLACFYRNLASAVRKVLNSDSDLSQSLLPAGTLGDWKVSQIEKSLEKMGEEDSLFIRIFQLKFFTGLTTPQVSHLIKVTENEVENEWKYGTARLIELIGEKSHDE